MDLEELEESVAEKEYWRRIRLCEKAIGRAAKTAGLQYWGTVENCQGCEILVGDQAVAETKVIVLMGTGHPPRLPRHITLTVHGFVSYRVNGKVLVTSGGLAKAERKFLPDKISHDWLRQAIGIVAQEVRRICATENLGKLRKEALAKRRQELRQDPWKCCEATYLNIS